MDESCSMCGTSADPREDGDPPLAWSAEVTETHAGRCTRWVCPACTRAHVRSIEAKLDQAWW